MVLICLVLSLIDNPRKSTLFFGVFLYD